jgi:hypothetical protein
LEDHLRNFWRNLAAKTKRLSSSRRITILVHFIIIVSIGIVIFRNFLFTSGWPAGGDALGIVSRAYLFGKDLRWLSVWRPHSFGFIEVINGYDFFLMSLHWIFGDAVATAKFFLFLTFVVSGFSSYALAYWYTRRPTASLAGAFVYILNQWLFSQYTEAHGDILSSYALAPLVFLSIFRAFETRKLKDILICAIALAVFVSVFHPECVVIYGSSFPIFAVTYVLMPPKGGARLKQFKNLLKTALPLLLVSLTLVAFLFIPMVFKVQPRYYSPTYKYYIEEMYGGVYTNMTDAFSLGAVEVWGYVNAVDVASGIALSDVPTKTVSLIIFSLAFCTVFVKRDKYTVFFVVSALVSIFISKGPNPPFGQLYLWAWMNVPYFAVFRAANRWIMMAAMSDAFLTAILTDMVLKYVREKRYRAISNAFSESNGRSSNSAKRRRSDVSLKVVRNHFVGFHKLLHYASVLLLIAIFLNGFLLTWYFFAEGLQVYSLPSNYVSPYEWIRTQSGDFKVVSVNRGPGRWRGETYSGFDFGFGGMLTEIGWAHDIGYESSFIHDHPVMQDGGWDPNAHSYVDYLRFRVVREQITRDFLKMVGLFNYKYVVLPAYLDPDERDFFLNQTGASDNIVYSENDSLIIENPYYSSHFFGTSEHINVLGGFGAYPSLCKIGDFSLNQTALFFADKLDSDTFSQLEESAKALVFVNSDLTDLTMLQLRDKAIVMNAADFGVYSLNVTSYWVQTTSWRDIGALVYGGSTLTTYGNVSANIPFDLSSSGNYDVWARVGFLSGRGNLSISVDSSPIGEIKPESDYWTGLLWVKMSNLDLGAGRHTITLQNHGPGFNDVDAIAVVEPNVFQSAYDELLNSIAMSQERIVDVRGATNVFGRELQPGWSIYQQQYEDNLLKAENALTPIREEANASASSVQTWHTPQDAIDGAVETRWASDPTQEVPQWFQMEYPTEQDVAGVRIFFETAYAKDYTIQTWNGTDWVMQVNVTGNMLLSPAYTFRESVRTDKLLLNVTAYGTPHHLVSVLEFEPSRLSSITANYSMAKEGRYMIALRLASGPEYGALNLKTGEYSLQFNCSGSQEQFRWFEEGPLWLDSGENSISVSAQGKILFDEMVLYSLKEDEDGSVLQNLFASNPYSPTIEYQAIDSTAYKLHIKTSQPFFLLFSESYNPLWKARFADGQEIEPVIAYSLINAFYINRTGEFDLDVYFVGQTLADFGLRISLASLIAIIIVLITPRSAVGFFKKHLNLRGRKPWLFKNKKK